METSSHDKRSFSFSSDGVIAIGASMQNIFQVVNFNKLTKGQLISKTIYGVIDSPKKRTKTI